MRAHTRFGLIVLMATAYACGSGATPRVSFVEPKDGATVKSPVHLKFGIENAARPDEGGAPEGKERLL